MKTTYVVHPSTNPVTYVFDGIECYLNLLGFGFGQVGGVFLKHLKYLRFYILIKGHFTQEQESANEEEQESKQRRRLGRVSFQCLSFNSFLHCVLPLFFPFD